jgi:hypothetical protein
MSQMANPVDEVFGGGGGGPEFPAPVSPLPRLNVLVLVAWAMVMAGPCCFTGVPGGGLAIWVWTRADETLVLVENGALGPEVGPGARRLRNAAFVVMGFALLLTIVQLAMFGMGLYATLLEFIVAQLDVMAI